MTTVSTISTISVETLSPFPPSANPYDHDGYSCGQSLGCNVEIMGDSTVGGPSKKPCQYIIIVHKPSGSRIRVIMPEMADRKAFAPEVFEALLS